MNKPTAQQTEALTRFANKNGRTWKRKLNDAWITGDYHLATSGDSGWLQQVRNQFGPSWLVRYKLESQVFV